MLLTTKLPTLFFCDYGGSAFGALYTDRPFLFLSPENPEQDKTNYCPNSPEVHLRNYFSTIDKPDSDYLRKLLTNAKHWELDAEIRKKKFLEFFEPNRGKSGKCAVQVLKHNLFEVEIILKCVVSADVYTVDQAYSIQKWWWTQ